MKTIFNTIIVLFAIFSCNLFAQNVPNSIRRMVTFQDAERSEAPIQFQVNAGYGDAVMNQGIQIGVYLFNLIYIGYDYGVVIPLEQESSSGNNGEVFVPINTSMPTSTTLIRLFPFTSSSLFLQYGTVKRDWKFKQQDKDSAYTIEGEFPKSGTSIGIGFNFIKTLKLMQSYYSWGFYVQQISGEGIEITKSELKNSTYTVAELNNKAVQFSEDVNDQYQKLTLFILSLGYNF